MSNRSQCTKSFLLSAPPLHNVNKKQIFFLFLFLRFRFVVFHFCIPFFISFFRFVFSFLFLFRFFFTLSRKAEEHLIASGLTYTIIHPGGLLDAEGGKRQLVIGVDDTLLARKSRSIPRADVAQVLSCLTSLFYQFAFFFRPLTRGGGVFMRCTYRSRRYV